MNRRLASAARCRHRGGALIITLWVALGIVSLGLPPAAASALSLLSQPAADGLESLVDRAVTQVVTSDGFAAVWATATRAGHRVLTTAATSDGGGLVVRKEDGVGILLDGARLAKVGQQRRAPPVLRAPAQLCQGEDRHLEFLGQQL